MELLSTLINNPSQATIIGGLILVIILLIRNQQGQKRIANNHLHGLPEMLDTMRRIEEKLDRNFEKVNADISYIRGRMNGKDR